MIGPDGVKVPDQSQALTGLGTKTVSDLIGENFKLTVADTTVTATGDVKNIKEPWTEYDETDNTGHFAPLILPATLKDQKIILGGRTGGDRTIEKMSDDLLLVVRLENLTEAQELTVKKDGELVMTVDFSGVSKES